MLRGSKTALMTRDFIRLAREEQVRSSFPSFRRVVLMKHFYGRGFVLLSRDSRISRRLHYTGFSG